MVYIIGTDHRFQHDGNDDNEVCNKELLSLKDKFKHYIIRQVIKLNIVLIGEEFSEEALSQRINKFGATNTSARLAALFTKMNIGSVTQIKKSARTLEYQMILILK